MPVKSTDVYSNRSDDKPVIRGAASNIAGEAKAISDTTEVVDVTDRNTTMAKVLSDRLNQTMKSESLFGSSLSNIEAESKESLSRAKSQTSTDTASFNSDDARVFEKTDSPSRVNILKPTLTQPSLLNVSFDFSSVHREVYGFVDSALKKFATNGANADELTEKREQALAGIQLGASQAKEDLADIFNDESLSKIDEFVLNIQNDLNDIDIPSMVTNAQAGSSGPKLQLNGDIPSQKTTLTSSENFVLANGQSVLMNFAPIEVDDFTKTSNLSKQTDANVEEKPNSSSDTGSIQKEVAVEYDYLTKTRELVSDIKSVVDDYFYNGIEDKYNGLMQQGYTRTEMRNMSETIDGQKKRQSIQQYNGIQHLSTGSNDKRSYPNEVAQYINKLSEVIEASEELFTTKEDYNRVINGLVNEMKDVQVPDLVSAINRIHLFNSKLADE